MSTPEQDPPEALESENPMIGEHHAQSGVQELSTKECWELLRTRTVARLAVLIDDHPDIFPVNYIVDQGALVFRTGAGAKWSAVLAGPVAVEVDNADPNTSEAWSVVLKGPARAIHEIDELVDTFGLPLFPWQAGVKPLFVRVEPTVISGRRFPIASPGVWRT